MKLGHMELNTQSTDSWEVGVCLVQVYQAVWASSRQFNCPTSLPGNSYRMIIFQEAGLVWEYLSASLTVHTYMCIYACMPRGRGDWCVMSVLESFQSLWLFTLRVRIFSVGWNHVPLFQSILCLDERPISVEVFISEDLLYNTYLNAFHQKCVKDVFMFPPCPTQTTIFENKIFLNIDLNGEAHWMVF